MLRDILRGILFRFETTVFFSDMAQHSDATSGLDYDSTTSCSESVYMQTILIDQGEAGDTEREGKA